MWNMLLLLLLYRALNLHRFLPHFLTLLVYFVHLRYFFQILILQAFLSVVFLPLDLLLINLYELFLLFGIYSYLLLFSLDFPLPFGIYKQNFEFLVVYSLFL